MIGLAALARALALLGGAVLLAILVLTVASVVARRAGFGAIPGDYEIVQLLVAGAVFAFLPWCQLSRGHAVVDILTRHLPSGAARALDRAASFAMGLLALLLAWRLALGLLDMHATGQTAMAFPLPVWPFYLLPVFACLLLAAVSFVGVAPEQETSPP